MSETLTQDVNIAELLVKQGVKTDDGITAELPNIDNRATEEVKPVSQEAPKVETTEKPTEPAEPPKPEPVRIEPTTTMPAAAEVDWKEVLKKQSEVEVYKLFGLDDKMINLLSKWKGGENLRDYFEALTVDYSKMSPEQIMRYNLQKEYGELSPEDFEEFYRIKVTEAYKLDGNVFDEKEVRRGKLLIGIDAEKIRQEFEKKQQELLLSKPPEPVQLPPEIDQQAIQREKDIQNYKDLVSANQFTKDLVSTRLLKIGDGEKAFNLEIQKPNEILDILYDPAKWSQTLWNEDGSPNIRKQLLLGAIAYDHEGFLTNLAKHYETLGASKVAEVLQNPSPPPGTPARSEADLNADPAAQLARFGIITSG